MPRSSLLALTVSVAFILAGCDRQSAEPAQPQESTGAEKSDLTGEIDRSLAGEAAPAITLTDPTGTTLNLAAIKGKPTLVNLWATWCVPCVAEMPLLDDLAAELGDSLRVLTVSEDMKGAEAVEPFFAERALKNLPRWMDPKNELIFAYGSSVSLPLTVMYDADGKEVWRMAGGYDWSSTEARELIAEASGAS
ncbi:MAG TPA: TlpA family protein disulfide reductase [Croceibacterium sp.]|nr:TlpA family protein disulfide reductase [Croceibacterium sp.]